MQLNGERLRLTRRQIEILALLALNPNGFNLGELHARADGDRSVSQGTLKVEKISQLRAVLGGGLESRPYRIGLDVRCDVSRTRLRLRAGDVAGAVERYGGELLPGSECPALAEFGNFVTVALRNALLSVPHPAAVQRYLELTPVSTSTCSAAPAAADLPLTNLVPLTISPTLRMINPSPKRGRHDSKPLSRLIFIHSGRSHPLGLKGSEESKSPRPCTRPASSG